MHDEQLSRHARQVLSVTQGKGHAHGPGSDPSIARSWVRCVEDYHLDPAQTTGPTVLEQAHILESRERMRQVLQVADGEMNSLHQQLCGAGHAVLLTDARGVILNCVTAASERGVFERAGLWLGADWSEACEGTNGIGTCVVERQPLTIHQGEHFRGRHTGLTCSASPVFDPSGELLAVLDVSSARPEVSRQSQFHTMTLVNLSAKMIESSYFMRHFAGHWMLRFHLGAETPGLFSDGLLAFGSDGQIQGVNQSALNLLRRTRAQVAGEPIDSLFDCSLGELLSHANGGEARWPLHSHEGRLLFASLKGVRPGIATPNQSATVPSGLVAAPGICMADSRLEREYQRALRVFERDVPLIITGETGAGKEAFARAVHQASDRRGKPFIALNCASIPESLIESELFGYRLGTFTGGRKEGMKGKLQQADGGTLLLDEIGDMPLALQTRLLRVLEDRQVVPLGGEPEPVDVRVVSATHRDLLERVEAGAFREDLYYRLNGLTISLPALRERTDRAQLIDHLLLSEAKGRALHLAPEAREALVGHHWPGNVRQLRTVLRTLVALSDGGQIAYEDLPAEIHRPARPLSDAPLADAERSALIRVLEQQRWHMTKVAEQLGVSRNTLYRKLRRHGLRR